MNSRSKIIILKSIKYVATAVVVLMLVAEAYLMIVRPGDDIAGGVFMALLMIALFGTIEIVANRYIKKWQ